MPDPVAIPCERADALSGLSEAALECTLTGEVTAANALALDMFGVAAEELVGGPAARWLTVGPALEDLARGGSAARARIPLRGRRANGVPFPLRGSVSRLPDTGSGPRALWRLHELQRNELLGAAHRFFEAGFEHAPIGMGIFNSDGEYVHVNAELERILGRPAAELHGPPRPGARRIPTTAARTSRSPGGSSPASSTRTAPRSASCAPTAPSCGRSPTSPSCVTRAAAR